ncbi:hypothetical protein H7347_07140 [Corynebacterium sp. zg-331]|nr:hypothetical protein [Corynebacterium sp. zg-331]
MRISRKAAAAFAAAFISLGGMTVATASADENCKTALNNDNSGVTAICHNPTGSVTTANLYVDCQPNWHNPHVRKSIGPGETVSFSTKCGGWSRIVSASAWLG